MDEHGWANVEKLIKGINVQYSFSKEDLEKIVSTDTKQRYSFNEDKTLIRANQGHSIPVDVELKKVTPPDILWHGTAEKYVHSIEQEGLLPMSRLYVHLSNDMDTAKIVGARHGKVVIFQINSKQMYEDGYEFFKSVNGVWLTKKVPLNYLHKLK